MDVFYFDAWCFPWNNDQGNYNITLENTYYFVVIRCKVDIIIKLLVVETNRYFYINWHNKNLK